MSPESSTTSNRPHLQPHDGEALADTGILGRPSGMVDPETGEPIEFAESTPYTYARIAHMYKPGYVTPATQVTEGTWRSPEVTSRHGDVMSPVVAAPTQEELDGLAPGESPEGFVYQPRRIEGLSLRAGAALNGVARNLGLRRQRAEHNHHVLDVSQEAYRALFNEEQLLALHTKIQTRLSRLAETNRQTNAERDILHQLSVGRDPQNEADAAFLGKLTKRRIAVITLINEYVGDLPTEQRGEIIHQVNRARLMVAASQEVGNKTAREIADARARMAQQEALMQERALRQRQRDGLAANPDKIDDARYLAASYGEAYDADVKSAEQSLGRKLSLEELGAIRATARERVVREGLGDTATEAEVQEWIDLVTQLSGRVRRDGGKRDRGDGQSQGGRERESFEDKAGRLSAEEKRLYLAIDDEVVAEIERERPFWDLHLTPDQQKERYKQVRNDVYRRHFPDLDDRQAAEILGIIKALRGSR